MVEGSVKAGGSRQDREAVLGELRVALGELGLGGRRILVAASGGVDSTVLAHGLHALSRLEELSLALGHVHHGLRGAEADADAGCVEDMARKLDVPFMLREVDPRHARADKSSRLRPTLQEAGREEERCRTAHGSCLALAGPRRVDSALRKKAPPTLG